MSDSIASLTGGGSDAGGLGGLGGESPNMNVGGLNGFTGGQSAPETDLGGNLGGLGASFNGGSMGGGSLGGASLGSLGGSLGGSLVGSLGGSLGGGSLGTLGGGSLGSLGSSLGGGLAGLGGGQETRSKVAKNKLRSFIPGTKRMVTRGYLSRVPLDDGRNAEIVKKNSVPRPSRN